MTHPLADAMYDHDDIQGQNLGRQEQDHMNQIQPGEECNCYLHSPQQDMRERVISSIHEWVRDCGLDVRDVEPFVDREIVPILQEVEQQSINTLAEAQLNMRPLIALKNGNGDVDNEWYVMYWDDKDQVWNRARYADIVQEAEVKGQIKGMQQAKSRVLRRTEIPKGARNPTRDASVIIGEECARIIDGDIAALTTESVSSNS